MKVLVLKMAGKRVGIQADCVTEVLPMQAVKPIKDTPPFVLGLADVRGHNIPVIDLQKLMIGQNCARFLSSRLVLLPVQTPQATLAPCAFLAEGVTEICKLSVERQTSDSKLPFVTQQAGDVHLLDLPLFFLDSRCYPLFSELLDLAARRPS